MMPFYKKFLRGGTPYYLARYYWWAYLWQKSIWFFDHQRIINTILFGQYEKLLHTTLAQTETRPGARLLQLACVYGKFTPSLLCHSNSEVHVCDVASAQLRLAQNKTAQLDCFCHMTRTNAEALAYANNAFDQVIVFFLFHELPPEARQNVYAEIARVVKPGGSVLITEYAPSPDTHWLHRLPPTRWLLGRLEPFLPDFWNEDVSRQLQLSLSKHGKCLAQKAAIANCFARFYCVMRFDIGSPASPKHVSAI
jgi:ubiquinone/menaquinone biosynthesis C-methylase UbiE